MEVSSAFAVGGRVLAEVVEQSSIITGAAAVDAWCVVVRVSVL